MDSRHTYQLVGYASRVGLLMGACAALLLLIPLWRDPFSRIIMLSVLLLLLGMWRYTYRLPHR